MSPICPAQGTYRYNPIGVDPSCSVEGHGLETYSSYGYPAPVQAPYQPPDAAPGQPVPEPQ